ncbi:hypothetical protein HRbin17_00919 [bacterium HR17]|jgi:MFS family permease/ribosomal protein L40E|uniref:FHA domain-containing protein n=1 Tax=Candidatus Fervidibacter japonicus TaxID=2035412 RepID=A0A2H5XBB6_9BACT|nr:hypothetical protein HRbin17_00919 [bacterium HR17]
MQRLSGRALARAVFGAIGGFTAWVIVEPFTTDVTSVQELFHASEGQPPVPLWALVGALIGVAIVGLDEWFWGGRKKAGRDALLAGVLGMLGGALAFAVGGWVFNAFAALVLGAPEGSLAQRLWLIVARSITWTLVGAVIGFALGAVRRSWRGAYHAGFGGALGGCIGGILFDTIAPLLGATLTLGLAEPGWGSRLIGLTTMGALIGLFGALAEQWFAPAILKVVSSGRMEGREFVVDKPMIWIGRDERCDVALYYDRQVQMRHAVLRWDGVGYVIAPENGGHIAVNDVPVQRRRLEDGDVITVGQTRLLFRSRLPTPAATDLARKLCSHCGALNRATAKFCYRCGTGL